MVDLKPCPFCGGEAEIVALDNWYINSPVGVGCSQCPVIIAEFGEYKRFTTEAEAIAAWNTRAERTCKNIAREWEKTSFAHAGTSFCCSECGAHYVDVECYYAGLADKNEEQIRTNYCPNCGAKVVCK